MNADFDIQIEAQKGGVVNPINEKEKRDPLWYYLGGLCVLAETFAASVILAIFRTIGWVWPVGILLVLAGTLVLIRRYSRVRAPTATELH